MSNRHNLQVTHEIEERYQMIYSDSKKSGGVIAIVNINKEKATQAEDSMFSRFSGTYIFLKMLLH